MGKQKINPRCIPRSQADVDRAYRRGQSETIEFACAVACVSLQDVFNPTEEQMRAFNRKFNVNVQSILDGSVKYADVLSALHDEYGVDLDFR